MRFVYKLEFHIELHAFIKKGTDMSFFFLNMGGEVGLWLNSNGILQKLHLKGFALSYCKEKKTTLNIK